MEALWNEGLGALGKLLTLDNIYAALDRYKLIVMVLIALIVKTAVEWTAPPEIKVEGSTVIDIKSEEEWNSNVIKAQTEDKIIVVDFFATWCPPCRKASPVFAAWSKDFASSGITFWKVDVDKVPTITKAQSITGMPTFKFFRKNKDKIEEIERIIGWDQGKIYAKLQSLASENKKVK